MDKYIILGVGKYVVNVEEILRSQYKDGRTSGGDFEIIGFLDSDRDKHGKEFHGYRVLGDVRYLDGIDEEINVISFINPVGRRQLFESIKEKNNIKYPNVIHSSAIISDRATIGKGNIVAQGVVIGPCAEIGDFNHFNYSVIIGHHTTVRNFTTCNGGAHVAGSSVLENASFVGPGAVIIDGVRIGERSKVGANAVVRKDVPADSTAVGVPARLIG